MYGNVTETKTKERKKVYLKVLRSFKREVVRAGSTVARSAQTRGFQGAPPACGHEEVENCFVSETTF